MKTQCPHCTQDYEIDEEYQLRQVECSACGNSFIVPKQEKHNSHRIEINKFVEQGEPHKSKKLKWFLIIIALVGFLSIIGVSLFSVIDPILKVNKFKEAYTTQLKDKMRDPESMTIDWKFAGTDKKGEKFLALCVVRAKNAMGGYGDPDYSKIAGERILDYIRFEQVEVSSYDVSRSDNLTYDGFYKSEEKECDDFYSGLENELTQIIANAERDSALIVMPELNIPEYYGSVSYSESYKEPYISFLKSAKLFFEKAPNKNEDFYKLLFSYSKYEKYALLVKKQNLIYEDMKKMFNEVDEKIKAEKTRLENEYKQKKDEEKAKEIERSNKEWEEWREKQNAKEWEEWNKREQEKAKRDQVLAEQNAKKEKAEKLKKAFDDDIAKITDQFILEFKKLHSESVPSKSSVKSFEFWFRNSLESVVEYYTKYMKLSDIIGKYKGKMSDRELIELKEYKEKRDAAATSLYEECCKLNRGILCSAYGCSACASFKFPLVKINFDNYDRAVSVEDGVVKISDIIKKLPEIFPEINNNKEKTYTSSVKKTVKEEKRYWISNGKAHSRGCRNAGKHGYYSKYMPKGAPCSRCGSPSED